MRPRLHLYLTVVITESPQPWHVRSRNCYNRNFQPNAMHELFDKVGRGTRVEMMEQSLSGFRTSLQGSSCPKAGIGAGTFRRSSPAAC